MNQILNAVELNIINLIYFHRKLQTLSVDSNVALIYDKVFANCTNLKNLEVCTYMERGISSSALNSIRTSFKLNKGLKKLIIYGGSVFNEDFSTEIVFKLKAFSIFWLDTDIQRRNLNFFLKTQSDTIETLMINEWIGAEAMNTVLLMPRLKRIELRIFHVDPSKIAAETLSPNYSVTHLFLTKDWNKKFVLKHFLKALPKIEFLRIPYITDEIAESISKTCKSLKRLSVICYALKNLSEFRVNPNITLKYFDRFEEEP